MRLTLYLCAACLVAAAVVLLTVHPAAATLGEKADSVTPDRKALSAVQRPSVTRQNYTVHELDAGGNVVREYVSPSGVVFAIAWSGLSHPDLGTLLGAYVGGYRQALQRTPRERGKRHFRVNANGAVVEKWGHMRNVHGRAYVPALLPSGVNIDEIE
ncbi:MAG TPA: DUF2844 domain-containing protein [Geobacteraceae bacterium]